MEQFCQKLGSTIKRYRKEKSFTQEELATRSEICPKYLGRIERGESNCSVYLLYKIASGLDADILDLVSRAGIGGNGAGDGQMTSIANLLNGHDEEMKRKVHKVIKLFLEESS